MWITVRLIAALGGFLFRHYRSRWTSPPALQRGKYQYSESFQRHKGKVTRHTLGIPFKADLAFVITRENAVDRFFKALGFSVEFQTQDLEFDRQVYIACDHPFLGALLKREAVSRSSILKLLALAGAQRVWTDGQQLYLQGDRVLPLEQCLPLLDQLASQLQSGFKYLGGRLHDGFAWRALVVEAALWSFAGYAGAAYADYVFHNEDFHLDTTKLYVLGIATAALIGAGILAGIAVWLGGSSRSHRLLVESFWLLLLSLPVAGIQMVSDINRGGDDLPAFVVQAQVDQCRTVRHRSRRGGTRYTYHLTTRSLDPKLPLPQSIQVSREVCRSVQPKSEIPIALGPGRLGLRWYRSINGVSLF